jgi:abortive infection bacteriophage resistance protein
MVKYTKRATSVKEQVELLASRGLIIENHAEAEHYLQFISYYRLSGYFFHFQKRDRSEANENFIPGLTFQKIINIYVCDRELRLLVMDSIERIEVAFRTQIVNVMSQKYGPHWFMDNHHFVGFNHSDLLNKLDDIVREYAECKRRGRPKGELFIDHYAAKYADPKYPPCWMLAEVLSVQTWSVIYSKLKYRDCQKAIAGAFGVSNEVLSSWLHCVTYLRNLCAHHSRLWRRVFTIKPIKATAYQVQLHNNGMFYAQAVILFVLLRKIAPKTEWNKRLARLFTQYPDVSGRDLGFPDNWQSDLFWGLTSRAVLI